MVATLPPSTEQEPPTPGEAPRCLFHTDIIATWTSPTGHHFCDMCRDLQTSLYPDAGQTLANLLTKELEPIRWTVEGMIPEGLTFLAGKPKLGKSWLALVLALAIASGNKFLTYQTVTGHVLYVALEDGERRIQERAIWLGARTMGGLENFHYRTEWATLDQGGLDQLEQWMADYPQTRLIVVDTFGRIRGDLPGRDKYAEEYGLLGRLQQFAIKHGIALICIHHLRKMGADDWIEQLSGSQAVTGAADTLLGLYRERGQMDATLRTVSRDSDELEVALKFNDGRWEYMGAAADYRHSVERTAVLDALKDLGGEGKVGDVAALADKTAANTSKLLVGLAEEGAVKKVKYGVYRLVEVVEVVEVDQPVLPDEPLYSMVEVVEELNSTPPTSTNQPLQPTHIKGRIFQNPHGLAEDFDFEPDPDDLPDPYEED